MNACSFFVSIVSSVCLSVSKNVEQESAHLDGMTGKQKTTLTERNAWKDQPASERKSDKRAKKARGKQVRARKKKQDQTREENKRNKTQQHWDQ